MNNQSTFRTLYLTILTIVTILCIIVGISVHVFHVFSFQKTHTVQEEIELESFDSIQLDIDAGDFSIVYGDSYKVSYSYPDNFVPSVSVTNRILSVTQSLNNFRFRNLTSSDYSITIEIPEGTLLTNLDAKMDMGNFELNGLSVDVLSIDADMGNIELEDLTLKTATVRADMGNVELNDCSFDSANCTADMGSIDVSGNFASLTAKCDLGSITVDSDSIDSAKLDLSTSFGSIEVNGKSKGSSYNQNP